MNSLSERPLFRVFLPLLFLSLAIAAIYVSRSNMSTTISLQADKEPLLLPPSQIEHFTFGHRELISDLLWLRAIQAFDFCGGTFVSDERVNYGKRTVNLCEKGWVFQMLDAATRISPRYRIIYTRGAVNLSVVVNDRLGARELYLRGMKAIPDHWGIFYQAGYHEIFEMNDPELGGKYVDRAGRLPGSPLWLPLLAAQLYNKAGQAEFGLRALADFYHDKAFNDWPIRVKERWSELETSLGRKARPEEFYSPQNQ